MYNMARDVVTAGQQKSIARNKSQVPVSARVDRGRFTGRNGFESRAERTRITGAGS